MGYKILRTLLDACQAGRNYDERCKVVAIEGVSKLQCRVHPKAARQASLSTLLTTSMSILFSKLFRDAFFLYLCKNFI